MLSDILKSLSDTKIFHLNFLKWGDEYAKPLHWILAWIHCNIFFAFSPTAEPGPRQGFKSIHNIIFNLSSKQYNIDNGIPPPNTKEKRPLLSEKSNDRELTISRLILFHKAIHGDGGLALPDYVMKRSRHLRNSNLNKFIELQPNT